MFEKWSENKAIAVAVGILLLAVTIFTAIPWVISSKFEADAFNRVTGKNVSTWDAMFVELRIQEQTKE
jgi:flagellar basal body-associated protein FliL